MRIRFAIASQKKSLSDTIFMRQSPYLSDNFIRDVDFYGENKESLAVVYNKAIKKARDEQIDALILVHDDVIINCYDLRERVQKYLSQYTILGLAGASAITIKSPVLWHLISERKDQKGCVAHGMYNDYYYTSFGPLPHQAIMIDGLFIAINIEKLPVSVKFDESNPAKFHFYDLNFSLDCSLNKVSIVVGDVPVIHQSPGLREFTPEWIAGEKYFLEKYSKYIGKTLTV
jgi:glycosyltransferase involved in cell wall biosynthesis